MENGGLGYIKSYRRSPREHMEERGLQDARTSGRKSSPWNEKTLDAGSLGPAEEEEVVSSFAAERVQGAERALGFVQMGIKAQEGLCLPDI